MNWLKKHKTRIILYSLAVVIIAYNYPRSLAFAILRSKLINYTKNIEIQEGDFIFQHLPGKLTEMVADVTQSPYSHCGIITKKNNKFYVLEAIGPVKETPLNFWISCGYGQKFALLRLKKGHREKIPEIIKAASQYIGRPYDSLYEWDDWKIYCSELIYKPVYHITGVKLADFVELGDLNWQSNEEFIRELAGGELPLSRKMITPLSLVLSDKMILIYTNFKQDPDSKNF